MVAFGFHVGTGVGVGSVVAVVTGVVTITGESVLAAEAGTTVIVVSGTGIPVFTGWPVTIGFITRAMTSTKTRAAPMYITSFLSIADHVPGEYYYVNEGIIYVIPENN